MLKLVTTSFLSLATVAALAQTPPPGPGGMTPMPNLVGMALGQARQSLGQLNGNLRIIETPSCPPAQDGKVVNTNPRAGTPVRPGMPIEAILCNTPAKPVPDVVGMPREKAFATLEAAGFGHGEEYGAGAQPGMPGLKVARQAPPAQTPHRKGDKVHLQLVR